MNFKCGACGRRLDKKTPFCPFCGARIGKARSRISPAALLIGIGSALVFCGMAAVIGLLLVKGGGLNGAGYAAEKLVLRAEPGAVAYPGDSVRIACDVQPLGAVAGPVEWSVSDDSVADLDGGVLTFKKEGEITVTAALKNGVEGRLELICGVRPERLSFEKKEIAVQLGSSVPAKPVISPAEMPYYKIEWTSSDERIVSVEQDGSLTAVGQGTARLTASVAGVKSAVDVFVYKYKFDLLAHRIVKTGERHYTGDEYYVTLDESRHYESGGLLVYGTTALMYSPREAEITLLTRLWDEDYSFYYVTETHFKRNEPDDASFMFYCSCDPSAEGGSFNVPLSDAEPIRVDASGALDPAKYRVGDEVEFDEYSGRDDYREQAREYAGKLIASGMRALKMKWSSIGAGCTIEEAIGLKML